MRRRTFIAALAGAAAWPRVARAQLSPESRPLIAWLGGSSPEAGARNLNAFLHGLQEHGHVVGRSIDIVYRWAGGDQTKQPALARELVSLNPNVIMVANNPGVIAAARATSTIPIVGALLSDPVRMGVAVSYNHPAKNVTGVLSTVEGLPAKQVEILLETAPASKVAVLMNPDNPTHRAIFQQTEASLRRPSFRLMAREARTVKDLDHVFETLLTEPFDGLVVLLDSFLFTNGGRIVSLASRAGVPAIHGIREHVERGGLMSYGVNVPQNFRRAAYFVDRILKGAKAGDLPIEFSTKLELVINLKTAKALGLEIPPTLLARADEVIE